MSQDRLHAILSSPSYRLAEDDGDFLESDGARAVRLALEFHRADAYLRAYGIESTVVVFGSARVPAPESPSEAGAPTIGLNIRLPHEQVPNAWITPGLAFRFHYFALRKMHFLLRARALVAFPGGFGTLDEVYEALNLVATRSIEPMPIVLVGRDYWSRMLDLGHLVSQRLIGPTEAALVQQFDSGAEAAAYVLAHCGCEKYPAA
jgi:predicted Rossmann-fold nucleotide-binding protein